MTDAKRAATEVVLGVETRISMSTLWWPWIILAEKPGRVKCAHDGEGLREPSVLGRGLRHCEVRWGRGNQQLWGRDRPSPEDRGDPGDGTRAAEASPPPWQQQVRLTGRWEGCPRGAGRRDGRGAQQRA